MLTQYLIIGLLAAILAAGFPAVSKLQGVIVSATQDVVDAITAQLVKADGELVAALAAKDARIADLEAQLAAKVDPSLDALAAAAQKVDDIVPDAPAAPVDAPVDPTVA